MLIVLPVFILFNTFKFNDSSDVFQFNSLNRWLSNPYKFHLLVLKVALLKEAAAKKDAEISSLQVLKERYERGEIGAGIEKFKSRPAKPSARIRASNDVTTQKVRVVQNDVGSGTSEVSCISFREKFVTRFESIWDQMIGIKT